MIKINPIADWSLEHLEADIEKNAVPINPLHRQGASRPSAASHARAPSRPGEDIRAGRWWWENEDGKECGLHNRPASKQANKGAARMSEAISHLDLLEAESIHIFREAAAQFRKPVLMYSIGKDSTVLLHLARKAFWPGKVPFPLLHIDTTWKFRDMIAFRDKTVARLRSRSASCTPNEDGIAKGINPIDYSPSVYTDVMKTVPLKQALDKYGFDAAFGGARRDEEASRAKERVFSFRAEGHRWDPRRQRPEMWHLLNGRLGAGETGTRVPALQLDRARHLALHPAREARRGASLLRRGAAHRSSRNGQLLVVDDDRLPVREGEEVKARRVRFRTLGCYPLTAAVGSDAYDIESVVAEDARRTHIRTSGPPHRSRPESAPWKRSRKGTSDERAASTRP